jgi:hypothetical protein
MDRQNDFFRQGFAGIDGEGADTATPRDRIDRDLRDRIFAEEDGIFRRDSTPTFSRHRETPPGRHLLRQIKSYSLALAQATSYLDTHPHDASLLRYFHAYRSLLEDALRAYDADDKFS